MNTKVSLYILFLMSNCFIQSMEPKKDIEKEQITRTKRKKMFLPLSGIKTVVPQKCLGGSIIRKKDGTFWERVDLTQKDSLQDQTFEQLIQRKIKEGYPYILATLLIKDKDDIYVRKYQDAGRLVNQMFDENMKRRDTGVQEQDIELPIHFFILYPKTNKFVYLGSEENASKDLNMQAVLQVNAGKSDGKTFNYAGVFIERSVQDIPSGMKFIDNSFSIDSDQYELHNKADLIRKRAAEKYYKKGVALKNGAAMGNLGRLYAFSGKDEEAKKYLLMAPEHDYKHVYAILAELSKKERNYVDAVRYYLKALKINDQHVFDDVRVDLVNILKELNDEVTELCDKKSCPTCLKITAEASELQGRLWENYFNECKLMSKDLKDELFSMVRKLINIITKLRDSSKLSNKSE